MKKAKWLCTLVLALCLALCMGVAVTAAADGELTLSGLSVTSWTSGSINGTAERDATTVECTANTQVMITATNYNKETITVKLKSTNAAWISLQLYINDTEVPFNPNIGVSSVANQSHTLTITESNLGSTAVEDASAILYINLNNAGTVTIEEISFGSVLYQHPEYVEPVAPPEATETVFKNHTEWTTKSDNVNVSESNATILTPDGEDEGIADITFTDVVGSSYTDPYTQESATITYLAIPLEEDAVPASWDKLYMKYKATSGIDRIELHINGVVIANNNGSADLAAGNELFACADLGGNTWNSSIYGSQDGYWLSITTLGAGSIKNKTALYLSIFFKSGAVAENEKIELGGMVLGSSKPVFATDDPNAPAAIGRQANVADRFTLAKDGANTLLSQIAGGPTDQFAQILVNGYEKSADTRFLKIVISADKEFNLGIYHTWSTVVSAYADYSANVEHSIYADLNTISDASFELWLFFDHNGGENVAKTYTIKSMTLVDKAQEVAPDASALTINYTAETVTFDAETIIVYSDQGTTAIESGAKVTPGTKLYMRTKSRDDETYAASELAEFNVPARPAAEEITPTASATAITVTKEGYSFKIGDGEWTAVGAFTGLTAGTEYTITYRKDATATSFASEEKTVKVTTTAAAGEEKPAPAKKGCKNAVSGGALYAFLAVCFAVIAFCGVRLIKKSKRD